MSPDDINLVPDLADDYVGSSLTRLSPKRLHWERPR
jgi:hypothetical protein